MIKKAIVCLVVLASNAAFAAGCGCVVATDKEGKRIGFFDNEAACLRAKSRNPEIVSCAFEASETRRRNQN